MTTVGDLLDVVLYDWLYPPDQRPVTTYLNGALTSSATTGAYDGEALTSEEDDLITAGGVDIEIDREIIMLGASGNPTANTLSFLKRGARGSTAVSHLDGAEVRVQPTWTRHQAYRAVSRTIQRLWPRVEARRYYSMTTGSYYTTVPAAVEEVEGFVYTDGAGNIHQLQAKVIDNPGIGTGKVVQVAGTTGALVTSGTSGRLIYRGRFTAPTAESDDLEDLGVTADLEDVVVVGAVAHMLARRDLDSTTQQFLSERLEAEGARSRPGALRDSLLRYFEYLIGEAARTQPAGMTLHGWST